jgi:hypothetical protein
MVEWRCLVSQGLILLLDKYGSIVKFDLSIKPMSVSTLNRKTHKGLIVSISVISGVEKLVHSIGK